MSAPKLTVEQITILAALADFMLANGAAPAAEGETAAEDDDLVPLDRAELKALIVTEELAVQVIKSMDDDAVREAIRAARTPAEEGDTPADETPAEADPMDELREVAKKVIGKRGDAGAEKVLKSFGVDKLSKIPAAKIPKAIAAFQAALKGK